MTVLNLIPFLPVFVKDLLSPKTRKIAKKLKSISDFLYHRGKDKPDSLAEALKSAEHKGILSHNEVIGEYISAQIGSNTLMVSITWSLYLLAHKRSKRPMVAESIENARLAYLEGLRLLPPFFMLSYDKVSSGCPFHFGKEPKTTQVDVVQLHRIPEYWGSDSHEYRPERFAIGLANLTKGSFIPFGAGKRMCPAAGLSMKLGPEVLHHIVKHYNFDLTREPIVKRRLDLKTLDNKMFFKLIKK